MIPIKILTQPDDVTCGPTCLHAVYQYYGDNIPLPEIIETVKYMKTGGTLAANLGIHALQRGYSAKMYSYNLELLDPSWFSEEVDLIEKLKQQMKVKKQNRLRFASRTYIEFLQAGGEISSDELSSELLKDYFNQKIPILAGLSAT